MLPYREKMFREKPYTQCFQCIQGNRLKCKKCMASIVQDVIQLRYHTEETQNKLTSQTAKQFRIYKKKENQTLQIKSCYGLWMDRVQQRRKEESDPLRATLSNWPRKKHINHQKTIRIQMPKFETWQRRLLSRFSSVEGSPKLHLKEKGLSTR